jgi:hypothetical protein
LLAQDAITVDPTVLDIGDIIADNKHIGSMYKLPIANVREEVWLHYSDMLFPVNHNT